jgi:hypothetical protein
MNRRGFLSAFGIGAATAAAPLTAAVAASQSPTGMVFTGVTFPDGVMLKNCTNVRIENCTFRADDAVRTRGAAITTSTTFEG